MKTPRAFGRPLIGVALLATFVAVVTVPRCNRAPQSVIVVDTLYVDTAGSSGTVAIKESKRSKRGKAKKVAERRVVRQRNYLNERVDTVK